MALKEIMMLMSVCIYITCGNCNVVLHLSILSLILVVFSCIVCFLNMKGGKLDSILSMILAGPGNVVDVPPPVAVAQVQVSAVRRRHHHHRQIQVLVHQGQVRSLGLVLHRGLGSHSRNEGRGNTGVHCSGRYVGNSEAHSGHATRI